MFDSRNASHIFIFKLKVIVLFRHKNSVLM